MHAGTLEGEGPLLAGYALLPSSHGKTVVTLRIGTSFISVDQARRNIDEEIPDVPATTSSPLAHPSLERTEAHVRTAWTEKLDRFGLDGATEVQKEVFWTGIAHALQVSSDKRRPGFITQLGSYSTRRSNKSRVHITLVMTGRSIVAMCRIRVIPYGTHTARNGPSLFYLRLRGSRG